MPQQWGLPPTPRVSALPCGPHGARPAQGPGPPQRPQRTAGALGIPQPTLLGQDTVASMWSDDPVTWHCTCTLPSRSNPLAQPHVESYPQHPGCCGRSVLPAPGNITAWRADGHCVKGVELPPPLPPPPASYRPQGLISTSVGQIVTRPRPRCERGTKRSLTPLDTPDQGAVKVTVRRASCQSVSGTARACGGATVGFAGGTVFLHAAARCQPSRPGSNACEPHPCHAAGQAPARQGPSAQVLPNPY